MFEVHQFMICGGWQNISTTTEPDGTESPTQFATLEEAQADINEFIEDINHEIATGERDEDEGYSRDDFAIYDTVTQQYV